MYPNRKRILAAVLALLPAAMIATWFYASARVDAKARDHASQALSTTRLYSIAAIEYAQDHKGRLPGPDWEKSLKPYVPDSVVPRLSSSSGAPRRLVMNAAVCGKVADAIPEPASVVFFFEPSAASAPVIDLAHLPADSQFSV